MYAASSTFLGYLGGVVVLANSIFPVPFCFRVTGRERLHFDISGISSIILTLSLGSSLKKKKDNLMALLSQTLSVISVFLGTAFH